MLIKLLFATVRFRFSAIHFAMLIEIVCMIVTLVLLLISLSPKYRYGSFIGRNLPKGPFPYPIIGNIPHLILAALKVPPQKALTKLSKDYGDGDLMSFWLGEQYMILLSSHSAMKELFSLPQTTLSRYIMPYVRARAFGKTNMGKGSFTIHGIMWNHDEYWQEMRRFTVRTLKDFGFGKKQGIEHVIHEEISDVLQSIKETRDGFTGVWELDGKSLSAATVNIVWNYAAGFRISKSDPRLEVAIEYGEIVGKAVGPRNRYTAFPWVAKWFPKLSLYEEHCEQFKKLADIITDIVEEVRDNRAKNSDQEPSTLLEMFLDEITKHKGEKDTLYTDEQLNVLLQDFFLAGTDTTATAISWMILFLVLHPEVQKKVYQEVMEVIGPDGVAALSMEQQLVYSKATILETYRRACFLPSFAPRYCSEAISYKGYTIPKGTGLIPNFDSIFHNKEVWGDPENFRPERFISTTNDGTKKLINADKVPFFGFGRRVCPGESVANTTMLFFLTTLLQKMELSVVPGKEPCLLPRDPLSVSLQPQHCFVKISDRR